MPCRDVAGISPTTDGARRRRRRRRAAPDAVSRSAWAKQARSCIAPGGVLRNLSPYGRPETIDETAAIINEQGGTAIAVRADHTVESEVESLFAVDRERGRLDVLVDGIAGEEQMMAQWNSFWKTSLTNGEAVFRQALLVSHEVP